MLTIDRLWKVKLFGYDCIAKPVASWKVKNFQICRAETIEFIPVKRRDFFDVKETTTTLNRQLQLCPMAPVSTTPLGSTKIWDWLVKKQMLKLYHL